MREPSKKFKPLFTQETPIEVEQMGLTWLVAAAIVTAIMWQIPIGNYILYPFSILATWFHEMGHGLMALMLGGQFQKLEISEKKTFENISQMLNTIHQINFAKFEGDN